MGKQVVGNRAKCRIRRILPRGSRPRCPHCPPGSPSFSRTGELRPDPAEPRAGAPERSGAGYLGMISAWLKRRAGTLLCRGAEHRDLCPREIARATCSTLAISSTSAPGRFALRRPLPGLDELRPRRRARSAGTRRVCSFGQCRAVSRTRQEVVARDTVNAAKMCAG